jgi:glycosyltransferase involved in cell wall biosynthesis
MSSPSTLLIWTENYWVGGSDRFLVDLVTGLRERPVWVVLAGNPHPEFDAWLADRVPWVLPRRIVPIANLVDTPLHRIDRLRRHSAAPTDEPTAAAQARAPVAILAGVAAARYGQAAVNLLRLRRVIGQVRPDAMLINNGGYPGAESCRVAAIAARGAGVGRVVQFVHNMAAPPAWPTGWEVALDRRIDRSLDLWVTAAERASAQLAAARAIPEERIATIRYGVAPPDPVPTGGDLRVRAELGFGDEGVPGLAVIANLEPRKGLSVLVDALVRLRARGITLATAIVGDGPMRVALERQIEQAGLAGAVRLLGWRRDVAAILAEADLLALPSLGNECLPYVILEAMTQGLPVVSTDVAGIPEMVQDEKTGRVVAPGDADALAAALGDIAGDLSRARQMGARGRVRVGEEFTLTAMVQRMCSVLGLG